MRFLKNLKSKFQRAIDDKLNLSNWYHISYDENGISWEVKPPGRKSWTDHCPWDCIECVCFKASGLYESDEIYLFALTREESYVIPTEADGGDRIIDQLIKRDLFDAELAIKAACAEEGIFCCPEIEDYLKSKQMERK
jgi:hypothetical protein